MQKSSERSGIICQFTCFEFSVRVNVWAKLAVFLFNCWHCPKALLSFLRTRIKKRSLNRYFHKDWNIFYSENSESTWRMGETFQFWHEIWIAGIDICWPVPMWRPLKVLCLWIANLSLINMSLKHLWQNVEVEQSSGIETYADNMHVFCIIWDGGVSERQGHPEWRSIIIINAQLSNSSLRIEK